MPLREPSVPISPEITRLTGITPDMVAGQVLDLEAVEKFIAPAELIIAHNAALIGPSVSACPRLPGQGWACSHSEIAWSGFGFEGRSVAIS
jgi:DNA polymerase-3 subunit epsilon